MAVKCKFTETILTNMIKWNNTLKNELPLDKQEVIIAVNGVNYFSTYDAAKKIFRTNELLETFFKVSDNEILWVNTNDQEVIPGAKADRARIYRGDKKPVKSRKH